MLACNFVYIQETFKIKIGLLHLNIIPLLQTILGPVAKFGCLTGLGGPAAVSLGTGFGKQNLKVCSMVLYQIVNNKACQICFIQYQIYLCE